MRVSMGANSPSESTEVARLESTCTPFFWVKNGFCVLSVEGTTLNNNLTFWVPLLHLWAQRHLWPLKKGTRWGVSLAEDWHEGGFILRNPVGLLCLLKGRGTSTAKGWGKRPHLAQLLKRSYTDQDWNSDPSTHGKRRLWVWGGGGEGSWAWCPVWLSPPGVDLVRQCHKNSDGEQPGKAPAVHPSTSGLHRHTHRNTQVSNNWFRKDQRRAAFEDGGRKPPAMPQRPWRQPLEGQGAAPCLSTGRDTHKPFSTPRLQSCRVKVSVISALESPVSCYSSSRELGPCLRQLRSNLCVQRTRVERWAL